MIQEPIKTPKNNPAMKPPGTVINHLPARAQKYVGSPSIAILPSGEYVASHDFFGRNEQGIVAQNELTVFGSTDKGLTWKKRADLEGFWQNLFVHNGLLYLMGLTCEYGHVVIRCSRDGGSTWTEPINQTTGLLLKDAQYHTAPVPMLIHNGRIWRAMEDAEGGSEWGRCFRSFMMSAPIEADLLKAANWTLTNRIGCNENWLGGSFEGWLEGNAVLTPAGIVVNVLRVDLPRNPEKAALVRVNEDGKRASFDPATDFISFPGGAKKFTIRYDTQSGTYYSLVNLVKPAFNHHRPSYVRNTLALSRSADLQDWEIRTTLLDHPDEHNHAFQYADWLIEGDDIVAVVRTAFDDEEQGAANGHDANYLTFHRFQNFRNH